jgi:nitrite reductase/ring-hydroxylating ferredoxin subunit
MTQRTRAIGITIGVVAVMVALAGLVAYNVVSREASPGPGWIKAGSVADIERQGVTKVDESAYVVSYGGLPVFAFAASYDEGVEGIHEVVSYCPSGGGFYNEPHATQYNVVGSYIAGPAPSSTLPRVAVSVLDGEVWVDPEQRVSGLIPGGVGIQQRPSRFCQS